MMMRTFLLATSRNLMLLISIILGKSRCDLYEQFVEEKGGPANNEAAQTIYPYATNILYFIYVTRLLINICSPKWPNLLKVYFYVEMLVLVTETFIPNELSSEYEQIT